LAKLILLVLDIEKGEVQNYLFFRKTFTRFWISPRGSCLAACPQCRRYGRASF